jgi:hypothetical protein
MGEYIFVELQFLGDTVDPIAGTTTTNPLGQGQRGLESVEILFVSPANLSLSLK